MTLSPPYPACWHNYVKQSPPPGDLVVLSPFEIKYYRRKQRERREFTPRSQREQRIGFLPWRTLRSWCEYFGVFRVFRGPKLRDSEFTQRSWRRAQRSRR